MNLGQYERCSQAAGAPMAFQYDASQGTSSQRNDQARSFDGLSRFSTGNELFNTWPSMINNYNTAPSTLAVPSTTEWAAPSYNPLAFDDANLALDSNYYYQSSHNFPTLLQNEEDFTLGRSFDGLPRTWQLAHHGEVPVDGDSLGLNTYDEPLYSRPKSSGEGNNFQSLECTSQFEAHDNPHQGFPQLDESSSSNLQNESATYPRLELAPQQKTQHGDGSDESGTSSREMTAVDLDDLGNEEPYAKLIYRALMSAPNHSMVLQEIYQWFRDNTTKGSSDTKGWMNSIRHNLSMNAVRSPNPL